MSKRIAILLISIGVLVAAVIFTIARANSNPPFTIPPAKQTGAALNTESQATAEAAPHATKDSPGPTQTLQASCPYPTPETMGLIPPFEVQLPFGDGRSFVNEATAKSGAGNFYSIWAGAPDDFPDSGLIRVMGQLSDPCAKHPLGAENPLGMVDYPTPKGPLTIIKIEGDTVVYGIASGGSGRFNFVTGQFLPLPPGQKTIESSCPWPVSLYSGGIYTFRGAALSFHGNNLINETTVTSSTGNLYQMWAGAPDDNPSQGLIRVKELLADPCASRLRDTEAPPMTDYLAPKGPLTFTQVEGDTIVYSFASSGTGRFNFVTDQFLP